MDSDHQRSEHPIAHALKTITAWHSFWDPRVLMNPLRPFIQKYYGDVMNRHIQAELQQRFAEMIQDKRPSEPKSNRAKSVIALALEAYLADPQLSKNAGDGHKLDEHFAKYASYQIRLFLFAGNDTTSSSIVYVYHLLSKHPKMLQQVRQEHDEIFGTDASAASKRLKAEPTLLNQCPLTLAVVKETLRLFPPASTTRGGRANASLTDRHGNLYPIDYVGANILHPAAHHNPRVWPRVDEFLPERFLVPAGHELYPDPGAWRPFEQGPRNCIGQTLVYNEMQVVLVMTARVFSISPAYDEWDRLNRPTGLVAGLGQWTGLSKPGPRTVKGERAYQTEKAGTHPADGYPCRVALVA